MPNINLTYIYICNYLPLTLITWTLTEQHEGRMCFNDLIYSPDETVSSDPAELQLFLNPLLDFCFLDRQ